MINSRVGHIVLNINPENMGFYKDFFAYLEWGILRDQPNKFGAGDRQGTGVWCVSPAKDVNNDYDGVGMNHLAIIVDEQQDVDRVCEYLRSHDVQTLFGTPCHRPEFCHVPKQTYYQVMFESPDRILFEVFYKGPLAN
jgi:catechol 2,3-dioxygenase-like lactoylglutathione lyase family enzyme